MGMRDLLKWLEGADGGMSRLDYFVFNYGAAAWKADTHETAETDTDYPRNGV